MVYEIGWTRALALILGSSTYAFSAMLATFLVGLALGALLVSLVLGRRPLGLAAFGAVQAATGLASLAILPALGRLPEAVLWLLGRFGLSHGGALASQLAVSFAVLLIPTVLCGAALPLCLQAVTRGLARLGRDVGAVYAANTVGCIVGVAAGGFLLIPHLGIRGTLIAAAGANVAVGVVALAAAPGARVRPRVAAALCAAAFAAGATLLPRWDPRRIASGVSVYADQFLGRGGAAQEFEADLARRELLFYVEGSDTTVSVERSPRTLSLRVNGKVDASNGVDMMTQLLLGHLPALIHTGARRALVIGLGSGVTAGALARHPLEAIDVAELEPAMVAAARFFADENRHALDDPRVRVLRGDGRHVLLAAARPYDLILSEPSNPWIAGVGSLFSREFYRLARDRLAPGGIVASWIHGYTIFPAELRMVARTFREVFPHATLWRAAPGDYLLLGTTRPLVIDGAAMAERFAAAAGVRADLALFDWSDPTDLVHRMLLGQADLARFAAGAPLNTDDRPRLEFAAPKALYAATSLDNDRILRSFRRDDLPPIAGADAARLVAPEARLRAARLHWAMDGPEDALDQVRRMGAAAALPPDAQLARARLLFSLGRLDESLAAFADLVRGRDDPTVAAVAESYRRAGAILADFGLGEGLLAHAYPSRTRWDPAEAHDNLGNFFVRTGVRTGEPAFFDLAVEHFEAALDLEPAAYEVLNNLGGARFEQGRMDEAIAAYQRSLARRPRSPQARFNLGLAYERSGRTAEAIAAYEEASRLAPDWPLPRQNRARLPAAAATEPPAP